MSQLKLGEKRYTIRLPPILVEVIQELKKRYGFKTESEVIRHLIREKGKELGIIEG